MNWESIQDLAGQGVPRQTRDAIAAKHGLDVPHIPTLRQEGGTRWAVGCAACTAGTGRWVTRCLRNAFTAPEYLTDVAALRVGVDRALTELGAVDAATRHALGRGYSGAPGST